jgi:hypothetical protein
MVSKRKISWAVDGPVIMRMRKRYGYKKIATIMGLSRDQVRDFCRHRDFIGNRGKKEHYKYKKAKPKRTIGLEGVGKETWTLDKVYKFFKRVHDCFSYISGGDSRRPNPNPDCEDFCRRLKISINGRMNRVDERKFHKLKAITALEIAEFSQREIEVLLKMKEGDANKLKVDNIDTTVAAERWILSRVQHRLKLKVAEMWEILAMSAESATQYLMDVMNGGTPLTKSGEPEQRPYVPVDGNQLSISMRSKAAEQVLKHYANIVKANSTTDGKEAEIPELKDRVEEMLTKESTSKLKRVEVKN